MQVTIKAAGLPGGVMRISGKISSQVSQCSDRRHRDRTCPPPTPATSSQRTHARTHSSTIHAQYLSALLMAAPLAKGDVTIEITDELVSAPYVHMTIKLMDRFGVKVQNEGDMRFTIKVA